MARVVINLETWLDIAGVFSGLLTVIVIGLVVTTLSSARSIA